MPPPPRRRRRPDSRRRHRDSRHRRRPASRRPCRRAGRRRESRSAALLLAFEVDGVDGHVGAFGRIDRFVQRLLAAPVHAVGEDHQRLPAVFGLHQLIRGQKNRVVELRAAAAGAWLLAVVAAGLRPLAVVLRSASRAHLVQFVVQLVARVGEVLEQLHLVVKVNQERLVLRRLCIP